LNALANAFVVSLIAVTSALVKPFSFAVLLPHPAAMVAMAIVATAAMTMGPRRREKNLTTVDDSFT
jgi:hypothetical protein